MVHDGSYVLIDRSDAEKKKLAHVESRRTDEGGRGTSNRGGSDERYAGYVMML